MLSESLSRAKQALTWEAEGCAVSVPFEGEADAERPLGVEGSFASSASESLSRQRDGVPLAARVAEAQRLGV